MEEPGAGVEKIDPQRRVMRAAERQHLRDLIRPDAGGKPVIIAMAASKALKLMQRHKRLRSELIKLGSSS